MSTLSRRAHVKETGIVLAVFLVIALILWAFTACNTASPVFTPKTGPHTDFPCGARGVVCGDAPPATNCCGPYMRCIPNGCTYDGDPSTLPDPTTYGARKPLARMPEVDGGSR